MENVFEWEKTEDFSRMYNKKDEMKKWKAKGISDQSMYFKSDKCIALRCKLIDILNTYFIVDSLNF